MTKRDSTGKFAADPLLPEDVENIKIQPSFITKSEKVSGCSVDGCDRPYLARGLCHKHYARLSYHGLINKIEDPPEQCTIEDCNNKHFATGLCQSHYRKRNLEKSREQARNWHHRHKTDDGYVAKQRRKRAVYREANRSLLLLENARYRNTKSGRFKTARSSALRYGKTWNLTEEEYTVLATKPCIYCGKEQSTAKTRSLWLDRIDCSKGYSSENVVPCCGKCNKLKNNLLTKDEMIAVVKLLKEMRGGKVWS